MCLTRPSEGCEACRKRAEGAVGAVETFQTPPLQLAGTAGLEAGPHARPQALHRAHFRVHTRRLVVSLSLSL